MLFPHEIDFDPAVPEQTLAQLPAGPAVFCLRGETGEPYLNSTADLRRRLRKLLTPSAAQSRRLQLASLLRRISWAETASSFAAQFLLYRATVAAFGEKAALRLHLRAPFFLRMGMRNRFPRLWVTNALTSSAMDDLFGPFPSRHAAERYAEEVLDLHLLRRCYPDLTPDPRFPGCIYSEMNRCLAPCYGGCSEERYAAEAEAVHAFLLTQGGSLLDRLTGERDRASESLDFELAASKHARVQKAQLVTDNAPDIAGSLACQRGVLVQPSVAPDSVDLYLLHSGTFQGPASFSLLGMRLPNEQSGSTSLFAHPASFAPIPLGSSSPGSQVPEDRLRASLGALEARRCPPTKQELSDHQAMLARWYFRPQAKRDGELVFAENGSLPIKNVLRTCARVFQKQAERSGTMYAPTAPF